MNTRLFMIAILCSQIYSSSLAQEQQIFAFDGEFADLFGYDVAIYDDHAIVGAYLHGGFGSNYAGAAYIFQLISGVWTYVKKLYPPYGGNPGDQFGISVDITSGYAIVGATRADGYYTDIGAAYLFAGSGNSWSLVATLTASDAASGDDFGASVGIDGSTAIVGAPKNDDAGNASGAAYIFQPHYYGWTEVAKLTASDADPGDVFGSAVAIEGDHALVGAPSAQGVPYLQSGAVYIFVPGYGYSWMQAAILTNSDAAIFDHFGEDVDIHGSYIIAGAPFKNDKTGAAYIFNGSGSTWIEVANLTASDGADQDKFGHGVGITAGRAVVGAPFDDDDGSASGSMYLFDQSGTTWSEMTKYTASDAAADDRFGFHVDIDGDYAIAGAHHHTVVRSDDGAAYIYGPALAINCGNIMQLSGTIPTGLYMADDYIIADGTVLSPDQVILSGANYLLLDPSFEVEAGALLELKLEGCP